jgi:hypothetical protein
MHTVTMGMLASALVGGGYFVWQESKETRRTNAIILENIARVNRKVVLQKLVADKVRNAPVEQIISLSDRIYDLCQLKQIPIHLVLGLIDVESTWDVTATSAVKAKGLMQIMPATAKPYLVRDGFVYTEKTLYEPIINVTVGISYLADLHSQFIELGAETDTDYTFSINSYFWGTTNVFTLLGKKDGRVTGPNFSYYKRVLEASKQYKDMGL